MRKLIISLTVLLVFLGLFSAVSKYPLKQELPLPKEKISVVTEESVVIEAVKKVGPSVVTVAEVFDFGPFSIYGLPQEQSSEPQNTGSGFIVDSSGLVVTNKHVVSDTGVKYQIITNSDKKYDVQKIYRDPLNDVAILKIDPLQNKGETLSPLALGDSSHLQVGQFVIAIGTALGEFRNTVTTGVISGLGRGITAGSEFQGYVERLDNVIQTDAAINPGNSGGPLLNSKAEVIGINTAIAQSGQNIGFTLPINVVKDSLKNFNETGQFNRSYLGVAYKMVSRDVAVINNLPEGAYIQNVVPDSSADKAGIQRGDIIIKVGDQRVQGKEELSGVIAKKKVGETATITLWRNGKTLEVKATFDTAPSQ